MFLANNNRAKLYNYTIERKKKSKIFREQIVVSRQFVTYLSLQTNTLYTVYFLKFYYLSYKTYHINANERRTRKRSAAATNQAENK